MRDAVRERHIERPSRRRDAIALGISFVIHALALLAVLLLANSAAGSPEETTVTAEVIIEEKAAPPPPPPRYYYRSRRYRYYDEDPEPLYALDLGVDLEGAVPLNLPRFLDGNNVQGGGGIKVRIGEQVRLRGGLLFTPEAGFGYDHLFASDDAGNDYSWDMDRVFGGARLAFGRFLVPVIYAHLGYGWRRTGDPTVPEASGLAFDVGGALDLRVVPRLGMGVHIEYATIDAHPYAPSWLALGLHLDLLF